MELLTAGPARDSGSANFKIPHRPSAVLLVGAGSLPDVQTAMRAALRNVRSGMPEVHS